MHLEVRLEKQPAGFVPHIANVKGLVTVLVSNHGIEYSMSRRTLGTKPY